MLALRLISVKEHVYQKRFPPVVSKRSFEDNLHPPNLVSAPTPPLLLRQLSQMDSVV